MAKYHSGKGRLIRVRRNKSAFVASEFEVQHEIKDNYFKYFLNMLREQNIYFEQSYVVDGRMLAELIQLSREYDIGTM